LRSPSTRRALGDDGDREPGHRHYRRQCRHRRCHGTIGHCSGRQVAHGAREATWRGLWPRSRKAAGTLSPAGPTSRGPRAANSSFDLAVEVSVGSMSSWSVRGWPRAACSGQPGRLERDDRPEPRGVLYGIQRPYQRSPPRGQATSPPSRRRQPLSGCHLGGTPGLPDRAS